MVANTKWDIKEVGLDNSPYVEYLLNELTNFGKRLLRETKNTGSLSPHVLDYLWEIVITHAMEQLVEGYARVKKCTNEGRTIMSLDLQILQNGLGKLTTLRPIPHVHYVDSYIKAYFAVDILEWCKQHPEYSLKQWLSIVNVGIGLLMKKKERQELITSLEEMDRTRGRK